MANRGRFAAIALPRSYRPVPPRLHLACPTYIYLCTSTCIYYLPTCITPRWLCPALPHDRFFCIAFFPLSLSLSLFFSLFSRPPSLLRRHERQEELNYFNSLRSLQFRYLPARRIVQGHSRSLDPRGLPRVTIYVIKT